MATRSSKNRLVFRQCRFDALFMPTTSSVSTAAIRAKCSSDICSLGTGYRSINTGAAGTCRLSIRRRLRIIPSIDPNSLTALGLVAGGRNRRHRQPISRRAAAPPARLRERGRPQRRPVPRAASRRPAAGLASLPRRWRIRPQLARTARLPEALCSKEERVGVNLVTRAAHRATALPLPGAWKLL